MEKVFEMNPEMVKLMLQKAKYNRHKLSRREQEIKRDSAMEFVNLANLYQYHPYIVKVHRNRMDFLAHTRGCAYNLGRYRYAEEPRKRRR